MKKLIIALGAVATLAACGSDDKEPASTSKDASTTSASVADTKAVETTAASDSETTAVESAPDTTSGEATGDTVIVESAADLPTECRDVIVSALKAIEPAVKDIDWSTATAADLEEISPQLEQFGETLGADVTAQCEKYVPVTEGDEAKWLVEIATEEVPGAVGFIEVYGALVNETDAAEFATCAEATAALDELIAAYPTLKDVPLDETSEAQSVLSAITEVCSDTEQQEIFARPELTVFLGG